VRPSLLNTFEPALDFCPYRPPVTYELIIFGAAPVDVAREHSKDDDPENNI